MQDDYVVALAGLSGFSVMICNHFGEPGSVTTIPSCYGADVALAADFNGDGHMGACHIAHHWLDITAAAVAAGAI